MSKSKSPLYGFIAPVIIGYFLYSLFSEHDLVKIVYNYTLPPNKSIGTLKISMGNAVAESDSKSEKNASAVATDTLILFKHSLDSVKNIRLFQLPPNSVDHSYLLGARGGQPSQARLQNTIGEGKPILGINDISSTTVLAIMTNTTDNSIRKPNEKEGDYKIEIDNFSIDVSKNEDLFIMTRNEVWAQRFALIVFGAFAILIALTLPAYRHLEFPSKK